jgi:hypothetical protein
MNFGFEGKKLARSPFQPPARKSEDAQLASEFLRGTQPPVAKPFSDTFSARL